MANGGSRGYGKPGPAHRACVLDNATISSLHIAGALRRVLMLWPGQWFVTAHVKAEAAAWKAEGARVSQALDELAAHGVLTFVHANPQLDGPLYERLSRTFGQGESETIAIAHRMGLSVALDDRTARKACDQLNPPVPWLATEEILSIAIRDGLISRADAEAIWLATDIRDPKRQIG